MARFVGVSAFGSYTDMGEKRLNQSSCPKPEVSLGVECAKEMTTGDYQLKGAATPLRLEVATSD
jgi:hypothetical protein